MCWHGFSFYSYTGITMDSLKNKINEIEKEEILKALKESGWIMAKAARKLGITERIIGYKVKKYGIRTKEVLWPNVKTDGKQ